MTWTLFWDMHSGGSCKEPPYEKIYIEAPEDVARVIFYNRFGHSPDPFTPMKRSRRQPSSIVSGVSPHGSQDEQPLDLYVLRPEVLVITSSDIRPPQREGSVPEQGYVWCD